MPTYIQHSLSISAVPIYNRQSLPINAVPIYKRHSLPISAVLNYNLHSLLVSAVPTYNRHSLLISAVPTYIDTQCQRAQCPPVPTLFANEHGAPLTAALFASALILTNLPLSASGTTRYAQFSAVSLPCITMESQ